MELKKKKTEKNTSLEIMDLDITSLDITNPQSTCTNANTTPKETIFQELRRKYNRKENKNYTQKEFAGKLNLKASKVSELESGKRITPSVTEAIAYNSLTGASLEYLFGIETKSTKALGLTNKTINNLQQFKETPNNEMAFTALNHLLSSPDAMQFLNLLYQLWISPIFNILDYDLSQLRPVDAVEQIVQNDSPLLSYALKCNLERQLLNYIERHGMYDENEYKKVTVSDNTDTATSSDIDELLES